MRYERLLKLLINFRSNSINTVNHNYLILITQITLSILIFSCAAKQLVQNNEDPNIASLMKAKIEAARIREYPPEIKITDEQLKAADPYKLLEVLEPYEKDSEWVVIHTTHLNLVKIANLHPDNTKVRQEIVNRLTESVYNKTDGGAGTLLKTFKAKDFNESTKTLIRQRMSNINKGVVGGSLTVWLCGVANIQDELPRLKELEKDGIGGTEFYYTTAWAAYLARARMGVKEDIIKCIEVAESVPDPNKRVQRILPDISYIRQPEAIKYLKKYLESNERLPSVDGLLGPTYGSWVVHILAECLENFPIKQKAGRNYTDDEVALCRKWMSKQKKYKIIR